MSNNHDCVLVASNLVSFSEGMTPGLRQDLLDCLLYAQLAADDSFSPRRQWSAWLDTYQRSIAEKGARRTENFAGGTLKIHRFSELGRLRFPRSVMRVPGLGQLFGQSLDRLMASEQAKKFFGSWFSAGRSESFQVVPCIQNKEDEATILLCGMQMTTGFRPSRYFWQVLAGEMTVRYTGAAFVFSRQAFEPVRQAVRDALAARAAKQIMRL